MGDLSFYLFFPIVLARLQEDDGHYELSRGEKPVPALGVACLRLVLHLLFLLLGKGENKRDWKRPGQREKESPPCSLETIAARLEGDLDFIAKWGA